MRGRLREALVEVVITVQRTRTVMKRRVARLRRMQRAIRVTTSMTMRLIKRNCRI